MQHALKGAIGGFGRALLGFVIDMDDAEEAISFTPAGAGLVRIALPGLSNLWLILLKDTALVSVIGLSDIIRQTGVAARVTKEAFLFFGVACLIYLALAILSSFAFTAIERWAGKTEQGG